MNIIVQKFGGTSVSTEERRKQVVAKVKAAIEGGYNPVVVVSAMGRKGDPYATDTLLSLLDNQFKEDNKQAQDMLMCCGEMISSVVMCNELKNAGIDSMPFTGGQAGIITDDNFTSADFIDIKTDKISEAISEGKVPVITGFQGVTENGCFTTLGRGGSDTSACILGVGLKAKEIEIYTDVDGIMTADPRIVKDASVIDVISYSEVFQLADQGAKVIHPRAVDLAMKANIPLVIKNTMSDAKGTLINCLGSKGPRGTITGITHVSDRIQVCVSLQDNKDEPNYRKTLDILAQNHISLDLINIFPKEQIFTIGEPDKRKLEKIFEESNIKFTTTDNCSTLAIVGEAMTGVPGIMAKIVGALNGENIEVLQTADSNMTIWCLVYSDSASEAINVLHKTFNLG